MYGLINIGQLQTPSWVVHTCRLGQFSSYESRLTGPQSNKHNFLIRKKDIVNKDKVPCWTESIIQKTERTFWNVLYIWTFIRLKLNCKLYALEKFRFRQDWSSDCIACDRGVPCHDRVIMDLSNMQPNRPPIFLSSYLHNQNWPNSTQLEDS